jgi:predicted nucleic acid-binding protein
MIDLIDSNVYIHAFRDSAFGEALRRFHQSRLPHLVLSVVVAHELLVGAANNKREQALRRGLLDPFRTRQRIHVPTRQTWEMASNIDRRLRKRISLQSKLKSRSFANDILIAASAREMNHHCDGKFRRLWHDRLSSHIRFTQPEATLTQRQEDGDTAPQS